IFMRVFVPASSTWSASTVAAFFVGPAPKLRVTEMMYNPKDPGTLTYPKDDYEFIELQNTGSTPLDPSGIRVADGIDFTFPDASDATLSTKDGWRSGQPLNGNPGGADAGLLNNSIVINELMPTATTGTNWIEFKNTTGAAIDLSGWYLSDDSLNRQKYVIPA